MTLKEYFNNSNIDASPDDRSRIGLLISSKGDSEGKVLEDGQIVKNYVDGYLENPKSEQIMMKYFIDQYRKS